MGQPRMDSSEAEMTLDTGQLRDTDDIGHRTAQRHRRHWTQDSSEAQTTLDTQDDTINIGEN